MATGPGGSPDPAREAFEQGLALVRGHLLFGRLLRRTRIIRGPRSSCPAEGWAIAIDDGEIHVHPKRRGTPEEWAHVVGHLLLHFAMGHFVPMDDARAWGVACCSAVERFLAGLKIGRVPESMLVDVEIPPRGEEALYRDFVRFGLPEVLPNLSAAGPSVTDLWWATRRAYSAASMADWKREFEVALQDAVADAVSKASSSPSPASDTPGRRALRWFVDHFPLLGALASSFEVVEDPAVLQRWGISVAAVHTQLREIYVDSRRLSEPELRFVMAHELLHAGLRHDTRARGRDATLWNVACDYVINGWLIEMGVGELPVCGLLHDPVLKGLSAEAVYDRIVVDLRRHRKLATFRGAGVGDMLAPDGGYWSAPEGVNLDEFYRSCLSQGLELHRATSRGLLPAGLVEAIRALDQPPLPWDVELARWFDRFFSPVEKHRSFARPSRRQSSAPDIPQARWVLREGALDARTFGVVLDTSASMERVLLAKALGSIASYALSRDVPAARVVWCDAVPYDAGYLPVEAIGSRAVEVRGRGGTVLQPALDLLERAEDFPKDGPVLVITDGLCDRLSIRREHAFLLPPGRSLPFQSKGPVFRMGER